MNRTVWIIFTVLASFAFSNVFAQSDAAASSPPDQQQEKMSAAQPEKAKEYRTVSLIGRSQTSKKAVDPKTPQEKLKAEQEEQERALANRQAGQNSQQEMTARDRQKLEKIRQAKNQAARQQRNPDASQNKTTGTNASSKAAPSGGSQNQERD